jgi:hypothetical protein
MVTGENATTWGNVTNTNIGPALGAAIASSVDITFTTVDRTLDWTNTNAAQDARYLRLNLIGTPASDFNLIVPVITGGKPYIVNNGTGRTITVKHSTGDGIAVPTGKTMWVYANGTNVVDVVTALTSLSVAGAVAANSVSATNYVSVTGGTGELKLQVTSNSPYLASIGANPMLFATNNVEKMRLTAVGELLIGSTTTSGNGQIQSTNGADLAITSGSVYLARGGGSVGIGTPTPERTFSVFSTNNVPALIESSTTDCKVSLYTSTGSSAQGFIQASAGSLILGSSNAEHLRFNTTGAFGVGGANFGTAGQVLTSQGSGAAPTWSSAAGSGTVTQVNTAGSVNGLTLTGGPITATGTVTLGGDITSVNASATINSVLIGYRSIPRSTTTTTANIADVGKCIATTANIAIPASVFAGGDAVSIYNNSASTVTISQGAGLTMYRVGTATTGDRTLAQRGMATIWFNSATDCVISGGGLS